jgi:hypothetical protein
MISLLIFSKKLIIDIDISIDNTLIIDFVIKEIDSESKIYFIVVDSIDDSKIIAAIIIMLVNKTFKHNLISMNSITFSANSISYSYNVFIVSRYDDREFRNILIDHDAADYSFEDIEKFTILQRINKSFLILNKKRIIFFKFDIDEIFSIDTINLKISVDVITFHIVLVHISFLFCLADMNRLRLYFNNLTNMLIEEQLNERFHAQILMSSKSLIRNEEMIFDLQIDMKIEHHSIKMTSNFHTNMKKKHHSMIRRYDHAFFL